MDAATVDPPVTQAIANVVDRVTSQSATVGSETFTGGLMIYDFDGPAGSGGGPHSNANRLDVSGDIWDTDATLRSSVLHGTISGSGSNSARIEIGEIFWKGGRRLRTAVGGRLFWMGGFGRLPG